MSCRIAGCTEPDTDIFAFVTTQHRTYDAVTNEGSLCERHSTLLHVLLTERDQLSPAQQLALELSAPMLASDGVREVRIRLGG